MMIRKKTGFFTFIFSFIPGAGEMYMGFFKQGASIMLTAFGLMALSGWLRLGPLLALLPVIWCYSFFHVHNLASLPDEEFYSLEDNYIFNLGNDAFRDAFYSSKIRKLFAVVLIVIGISSIWNMFTHMLYNILPDFYNNIFYDIISSIPQFIVALIVIAVGVVLIKGKKIELDKEEPYIDTKESDL